MWKESNVRIKEKWLDALHPLWRFFEGVASDPGRTTSRLRKSEVVEEDKPVEVKAKKVKRDVFVGTILLTWLELSPTLPPSQCTASPWASNCFPAPPRRSLHYLTPLQTSLCLPTQPQILLCLLALPRTLLPLLARHQTSLRPFALPWMLFPLLALPQTLLLPLALLGMLLHPLPTLLPIFFSHFFTESFIPPSDFAADITPTSDSMERFTPSCGLMDDVAPHSGSARTSLPLELCCGFRSDLELRLGGCTTPQLCGEYHFHHWHRCVCHANQLFRNPLIAKVGTLGAAA